jgi:hypothetical protein
MPLANQPVGALLQSIYIQPPAGEIDALASGA